MQHDISIFFRLNETAGSLSELAKRLCTSQNSIDKHIPPTDTWYKGDAVSTLELADYLKKETNRFSIGILLYYISFSHVPLNIDAVYKAVIDAKNMIAQEELLRSGAYPMFDPLGIDKMSEEDAVRFAKVHCIKDLALERRYRDPTYALVHVKRPLALMMLLHIINKSIAGYRMPMLHSAEQEDDTKLLAGMDYSGMESEKVRKNTGKGIDVMALVKTIAGMQKSADKDLAWRYFVHSNIIEKNGDYSYVDEIGKFLVMGKHVEMVKEFVRQGYDISPELFKLIATNKSLNYSIDELEMFFFKSGFTVLLDSKYQECVKLLMKSGYDEVIDKLLQKKRPAPIESEPHVITYNYNFNIAPYTVPESTSNKPMMRSVRTTVNSNAKPILNSDGVLVPTTELILTPETEERIRMRDLQREGNENVDVIAWARDGNKYVYFHLDRELVDRMSTIRTRVDDLSETGLVPLVGDFTVSEYAFAFAIVDAYVNHGGNGDMLVNGVISKFQIDDLFTIYFVLKWLGCEHKDEDRDSIMTLVFKRISDIIKSLTLEQTRYVVAKFGQGIDVDSRKQSKKLDDFFDYDEFLVSGDRLLVYGMGENDI